MIIPSYDMIMPLATVAIMLPRDRPLLNQTLMIARFPRVTIILLTALTTCLSADDAPPKPLSPAEARKKVGEQILLEMTVKTAKDRLEKRGEIYLDAELDFRDEKNFATVINREGAFHFQEKGVKDFEEHFRGKTIRVKGTVTVVEDVPRIEVSDAKQVEIVTNK